MKENEHPTSMPPPASGNDTHRHRKRRQQTPYRLPPRSGKQLLASPVWHQSVPSPHPHSLHTPLADITNRKSAQYTPIHGLMHPIGHGADSWGTPFSPLLSYRGHTRMSSSSSVKRPLQHHIVTPGHPVTPYSPSIADTSIMTAHSHFTNTTFMTDATAYLDDSFMQRGRAQPSWIDNLQQLITWESPRNTWAAILSLAGVYALFRLVQFNWPISCVFLIVFGLVTLVLHIHSKLTNGDDDTETSAPVPMAFDRHQFEYQVFALIRPVGSLFEQYFALVNGDCTSNGTWKLLALVGVTWLLVLCRIFVAEWDTIALVCSMVVLCVPKFATTTWEGFIGPESPLPPSRKGYPSDEVTMDDHSVHEISDHSFVPGMNPVTKRQREYIMDTKE